LAPRAWRAHHEKLTVGIGCENLWVCDRQDWGGVEHDKPEFEAQAFHKPAHSFRSQDTHGILEVRAAGYDEKIFQPDRFSVYVPLRILHHVAPVGTRLDAETLVCARYAQIGV